jgi:hypothetical protein
VLQSIAVELDWPGKATVTLSATGGVVKPTSLTFANTAGPLRATFMPTAVGKATIIVSGGEGLSLPEPASMNIVMPHGQGGGQDKTKDQVKDKKEDKHKDEGKPKGKG